MQPVYLICGVPGAGKTWVCRQLASRYHYVPHDDHLKDHARAIITASAKANVPIITECPFGERPLKEKLESFGLKVIPFFVVDTPEVIARQYKERTGRALPQASFTRATSIMTRVREWNAYHGTSTEVLHYLGSLEV